MPGPTMKPHAVHWRINSPCNRTCPFCYGPEKIEEAAIEEALPVLDKLIDFGIESIIITGGEPMLSRKFAECVRYIHANGAKVVLYTNCDFWDRHDETLQECLDTLCLPIEGASEYVHDTQRGQGSMRAILSVMNRYANGGAPFKVKVGTVIGRHNVHDLPAVLYLLDKYKINVWKLYEYIRYDDRTLQKQWEDRGQGITDGEYRAATQSIVNTPGRKTPVGLSSEHDRDQSYFMVQPNLDVIVPVKQENGQFHDQPIGSAKELAMSEIQERWEQAIDFERYTENLSAARF